MTDRNLRLIGKYALLLSILHILEIIVNRFSREFYEQMESYDRILVSFIPYAFTFLLNIIVATFVHRDIEALHIKTSSVIIATALYRPIGVVAFLLFAIYEKEITKEEKTNH